MTETTSPNTEILKEKLQAPFDWQNKAKLENIPANVRPVVEEMIQAIKLAYDSELRGALYLDGSVVSGNYVPGKSDIDGVWISATPLDDNHPDRRSEAFGRINIEGITRMLDVVAMEVADISDPSRAPKNFECYYNGTKIAGDRDVDFEGYVPKTKGDYLLCMLYRFPRTIRIRREQREEQGLNWNAPNFTKQIQRAWFMYAYLTGCPYEQSITQMAKLMEEHGYFDELANFQILEDLRTKVDLSEAEKDIIFDHAEQIRVLFEPVMVGYESDYATWRRNIERD